MNQDKYLDLAQSLAESEKELSDRISQECASNFYFAIQDSVKEIKADVGAMTEVIEKIQSCRESYEKASETVINLGDMLNDIETKMVDVNSGLKSFSETAGIYTDDFSVKVTELLDWSEELVNQTKENEDVLEKANINIKKTGEEYRSSIELFICDAKKLSDEINEHFTQFITEHESFSSNTENAISSINDLNSRFESIKEEMDSSIESIIKNKDILVKTGDEITLAEERITAVCNSFSKLEEQVDKYSKDVYDKLDEYLNSIKNEANLIVSQTDKFAEVLLKNTTEVAEMIEYQRNWKENCEEIFCDFEKKLEGLTSDFDDKRRTLSSDIKDLQEYHNLIESCVSDVKSSTSKYLENIRETNSSVLESFDAFKGRFEMDFDEQSKVIEEIREEQQKLRKMYIFGIILTIVIIVLLLVNIMY